MPEVVARSTAFAGPSSARVCHDRRREDGAEAVELGIWVTFFVFLFVVAVDFARISYFIQIVENCARQGALYAADPVAASQSPYASLQAAALADASNLSPQPTVSSATGTDASGNDYVRVTVAYQFQTFAPFPGIPRTVNVSRTVQMRVAPS